jgi:hypothetical protein
MQPQEIWYDWILIEVYFRVVCRSVESEVAVRAGILLQDNNFTWNINERTYCSVRTVVYVRWVYVLWCNLRTVL